MATGAVGGVTVGYYVGNATALYGYTGGIGFGMFSCAFFGTTYVLQKARTTDDVYNYAASGCFNSAWVAMGLYGPRRGGVAALAGAVCGALYKVSGDYLFDVSKQAWINHRRHVILHSKPRVLDTMKPRFPGQAMLPRKNINGDPDINAARDGGAIDGNNAKAAGVAPSIIPKDKRQG
jgi:hypothetical protein